jgi:hypoxanthine phosphoribosyltransferase
MCRIMVKVMGTDKSLFKEILFTEEEVGKRIDELADILIEKYIGQDPLFVCLLRGGAPFAAKLMFAIAKKNPFFHPQLDYMTVRTYGHLREAKEPEIVMGLSPSAAIKGRPVIILDDILDTGVTASFVSETLKKQGAKNADLCVLVNKEKTRPEFNGEIVSGFDTPPDWQTGMGLDDPRVAVEGNRWAPFIAIAEDAD